MSEILIWTVTSVVAVVAYGWGLWEADQDRRWALQVAGRGRLMWIITHGSTIGTGLLFLAAVCFLFAAGAAVTSWLRGWTVEALIAGNVSFTLAGVSGRYTRRRAIGSARRVLKAKGGER